MTSLSILIPVYNEEESLKQLHKNIVFYCNQSIKENLISNYEIWFISDGSTDNSENIIKELIAKNIKTKCVIFRKNFGKSKALHYGFQKVKGDIVLTMDADLQDDPVEIPNFIRKINDGYDLVSGWKQTRLDPLEKTLPSKIFNFVTSRMSGINIHDFNCGYKAYRKEVVKSLNIYGEFHRYIPIFAARNGFKVTEIIIKHHKREFGKSKYGIERYLRGMFDAFSAIFLLKYYDRPMYFFGSIGVFLFIIGFLVCAHLSLLWFQGISIGGRPLLILGILFILVGIQFFSLGLIANFILDNKENTINNSYVKEIIEDSNDD